LRNSKYIWPGLACRPSRPEKGGLLAALIHNRSCTLRQRRRLYRHKITIYDVDPRFSIRKIKQMLDDHHIDFTAVNTVKSNSTNKRTLYIGIEDPALIRRHKGLLQSLFNTRNYNRIYNNEL
jgi:hypothetical protein